MKPLMCLSLAVLVACGAKQKRSNHKPRYIVGSPGEGWRSQPAGSADHSWYHSKNSAVIYTSANCGERYEDGRLEDLSTHLTFGIARGLPLREEQARLDDREALIRVYEGKLDGVAVRVGAAVTKKHDCLYDMLYIAPPSTFDDRWSDFVQVIEGFAVTR